MFILIGCNINDLPSKCAHEESSWIIDNEATCSNIGKKHTECIKCHETIKEEEIEKLPHSLIYHEGKEPTETSSGYKAYDTCKNCDYTTYEEIVYQKHNFVNYVCTECFESSPENLKYKLMDDESGYCVEGLYNPHTQIKKITIPNEYNGKPVVGVDFYSFYDCINLNFIVLSNNTSYITGNLGKSLFYNEYDNGYYLGSNDNPYLILIKTKNKEIESIKISESTKIIYNSAFYKCTSLTSITIPSSVTSIGKSAFYDCDSLIIYCEAASKPSGWDSDWNCSDRPVVWGYKKNNN